MGKLATGLILFIMTATPSVAAHNNPWATLNDIVLGKKHVANQARSIGTPGEDEMRGDMARDESGAADRGGPGRGSGAGGSEAKTGSGGSGGTRGDGAGGRHGH